METNASADVGVVFEYVIQSQLEMIRGCGGEIRSCVCAEVRRWQLSHGQRELNIPLSYHEG